MNSSLQSEPLTLALAAKEAKLLKALAGFDSLIVAYSGGVDSSTLAHYARVALGERARIVIAISPSLATSELADARKQAAVANFNLIEIYTDEVDSSDYRANDSMRCFFCKNTLFAVLEAMRNNNGIAAIAYGANLDDLNDYRPGHQAAKQYGVIAPLIEAGLSKADIRMLARKEGLPSADRPQAACLSSRFAEHTYITPERLALVDMLEQVVRSFDFDQVRVRYLALGDDIKLSVEVGADQVDRFKNEDELEQNLLAALFARAGAAQARISAIEIDQEGYKQGKAAR